MYLSCSIAVNLSILEYKSHSDAREDDLRAFLSFFVDDFDVDDDKVVEDVLLEDDGVDSILFSNDDDEECLS